MPNISTLDLCRQHLFTAEADIATQEYLRIVNTLLPELSEKSRDFHRWRYNKMIMETYQMAKARKDTKTMERAATSYGKLNKVDAEDVQAVPFHLIVVQPFTATDDPTVLGIKPIPGIEDKIKAMLDKYSAETLDIEDVDFDEADLESDTLFPKNEESKNEGDYHND